MRKTFGLLFETFEDNDWRFLESIGKCNNVSSLEELKLKLQLMGMYDESGVELNVDI
jgi:hypothetical protein